MLRGSLKTSSIPDDKLKDICLCKRCTESGWQNLPVKSEWLVLQPFKLDFEITARRPDVKPETLNGKEHPLLFQISQCSAPIGSS